MAAYGAEREWESETGMILMLISGCLEKLVESGTELKNMFAQYFANREKCREETDYEMSLLRLSGEQGGGFPSLG